MSGPACPALQVKEPLAQAICGLSIACGSGNPSVPGPLLGVKGAGFQTPPGRPLKPPGHSWGRTHTQGARYHPGGMPVLAVFQAVNHLTPCEPVPTDRMGEGGYDRPGTQPTWLRCPCPFQPDSGWKGPLGMVKHVPGSKPEIWVIFREKVRFDLRCRLWSYSCTAESGIRSGAWTWCLGGIQAR